MKAAIGKCWNGFVTCITLQCCKGSKNDIVTTLSNLEENETNLVCSDTVSDTESLEREFQDKGVGVVTVSQEWSYPAARVAFASDKSNSSAFESSQLSKSYSSYQGDNVFGGISGGITIIVSPPDTPPCKTNHLPPQNRGWCRENVEDIQIG